MRHRKQGGKVGDMKEMLFKISVSSFISMYYYIFILILAFKLDIIIKLICK